MALSKKDRFKLKSQLIDAVRGDDWPWQKTNLLLIEFGAGELDQGWDFADAITALKDDAALIEMYALVMDIDTEEVENVVESTEDPGNWKPGYVRLFLTHSAMHKNFAGEVADELAVTGVHAFVAHDTMAYDKPWQEQIERALQSMQAFVALVHPEMDGSPWCHQEIGWALGRRVPRYVVRMGADPTGFIGRQQWPSEAGKSAKAVASVIGAWVHRLSDLGAPIVDGLLSALESAGNYIDAGATAERIAALGTLTAEDFNRLDRIWWSNDQVHGGILPTRALEPLYRANARPWPPPQPAAPSAGWTEEEPF